MCHPSCHPMCHPSYYAYLGKDLRPTTHPAALPSKSSRDASDTGLKVVEGHVARTAPWGGDGSHGSSDPPMITGMGPRIDKMKAGIDGMTPRIHDERT